MSKPIKIAVTVFAFYFSANAFAFVPEIDQKLDILLASVRSPKATAEIKADINSLIGPDNMKSVEVISFDCDNTKSTSADYNFSCNIEYGVGPGSHSQDQDDEGAGFQLLIDGHVSKGKRVIDGLIRKLTAG